MMGSFCPVTLAHVQCYIDARDIILKQASCPTKSQGQFDECLGLVRLNHDSHVRDKVAGTKDTMIIYKDRCHLINLAATGHPWLSYDDGYGLWRFQKRWPSLKFTSYDMNGADDVFKKKKWTRLSEWGSHRMIVVGRPGFTQMVHDGMQSDGIYYDNERCLFVPEISDVSSTEARRASKEGDEAVHAMLHPDVAAWLVQSQLEHLSLDGIA